MSGRAIDWDAMSERERDAVVAEAMGIVVHRDTHTIQGASHFLGAWDGPPNDEAATPVPRYSTDHNALAAVRKEVVRRGLQGQFAGALQELMPYATIFELVNATPEQQCRAFLWACGVSDV